MNILFLVELQQDEMGEKGELVAFVRSFFWSVLDDDDDDDDDDNDVHGDNDDVHDDRRHLSGVTKK